MYWKRIIIEHPQVDIVDQFAAQYSDEHSGKWSEADWLGGGCVLVRRSALAPSDRSPAPPLRFLAPESLSRCGVETGFRPTCCRDLFAHSSDTRSFARRDSRSGAGSGCIFLRHELSHT